MNKQAELEISNLRKESIILKQQIQDIESKLAEALRNKADLKSALKEKNRELRSAKSRILAGAIAMKERDTELETLRAHCERYSVELNQIRNTMSYHLQNSNSENNLEELSGLIAVTAQKVSKKISRKGCLLYTSPSPRDATLSRMPSSA